MQTIHISMTSAFQCEFYQCFKFKSCDKFKLKCTSHGGMYSAHYFGKISGFLELYSRFQSLGFRIPQAKLSCGEPSNTAVSRRPWRAKDVPRDQGTRSEERRLYLVLVPGC